jgi:hypothetical protein
LKFTALWAGGVYGIAYPGTTSSYPII